MLIVTVVYNLKGELQEEFMKEIIEKGIQSSTQSEEGNSLYEFMIPWGVKDKVFLLEYWKDESVLKYHQTLDHYFVLQDIKAKYVERTDISKFIVN